MPGMAIILGAPGQPDLARSLAAMLAPLTYPGYAPAELVLSELGIAIGHTGPARAAAPQPGYARAGRIAALVEGEALDRAAIGQRLGLPPAAGRAEVIAALYAAEGPAGLETLEGHWAAAVVDRDQHKVTIANDAFGLRPLYRMRAGDGAWLLATNPAALLAHPAAPRGVNPAGLADFLALQHPLGAKTLFRGLERLPAAAVLTWADGELATRCYWTPELRPEKHGGQADLERLRLAFNSRVAALMAAGRPFSLALTGGGDSRAILSAMLVAGVRPHTVTHTVAGATDAQLAAEIARRAGVEHHFYEVVGEEVAAQLEPGIRLIAGQAAGIDVHPLCFLEDYPRFTHAMFTGLGGNVYKGDDYLAEGNIRIDSTPELARWLLLRYNSRWSQALLIDEDFPELLTPDWLAALKDQPLRSITECLENQPAGETTLGRTALFYLQERVVKFLIKGDAIVRREVETRHPFMSRALLEQTWRLPAPLRYNGEMESYIITRNAPHLADVTFTWVLGDGPPMRPYPRSRAERLTTAAAQWWQIARARRGHHPRYVQNYRYGDWLRGPLRAQLTDVLLDPRTAGRGFFRPETIRRWLDEHMAGQNRTKQLMALLGLELTLRAFVDSPGADG